MPGGLVQGFVDLDFVTQKSSTRLESDCFWKWPSERRWLAIRGVQCGRSVGQACN